MDTSARQRGFEIRISPLLGELPKATEHQMPVCQLYRWKLGPNMWSSPTTKSLDPIVATALRVGFQGESHGLATCGFACNCTEPEAWTTEASGQLWVHSAMSCRLRHDQIHPLRHQISFKHFLLRILSLLSHNRALLACIIVLYFASSIVVYFFAN